MKVLLLALDTLRADHLSGYGYYRPTSPVLDELMAKGTGFLNCSSAFSVTLPSFTSIVTGKYCANHKMVINPFMSPNQREIFLDDTTPTLAEVLLDQGYTTAAFDNLINFASHPSWFVRGYEYYVNVTRTSEAKHHWILADDINNRLLPWLREHASEDFFVFAHYWDPHKPYNAPEPYDSMYLDSEVRVKKAKSGESYVECAGPLADLKDPERANLARYDGEINYLDNRLGQVLEALESYGIADETAIIIVGDHGEIMVERDVHFDHRGVWNFNVRVPLILYSPTLAPQVRRSDSYVHHVDLFPTVLDLLGLEPRKGLDGSSLLPLITKEQDQIRPYQFGEGAYLGVPQRYIQDGSWKLIKNYTELGADNPAGGQARTLWTEAPPLELYDLETDPEETLNLASSLPDRAREMEKLLESYLTSILDDPDGPDAFAVRQRVAAGNMLWND